MGAFYLQPGNELMPASVEKYFSAAGFGKPLTVFMNGFTGYFFPKQHSGSVNWVGEGNNSLYITGTCFVKGKTLKDGLNSILEDYLNHEVDPLTLTGNYFLLFNKDGTPEFLTDPDSIQNIFFHRESGIISSSFLACMAGASEKTGRLSLNRFACTEILTTGMLTGTDTLIHEIERFNASLSSDLPGIKRIKLKRNHSFRFIRSSLKDELAFQLTVLKDYFEGLTPVLEELGVLSGLTGGFDSRLLFLLLLRNTRRLSLYSTWRPVPNREFQCAKMLAGHYGFNLLSPSHRRFDELNSEEFLDLLRDNMYFNDGQCRSFQLWTEEIKSKSYLESLYGDYFIGMSGVGGEQYRNAEYLVGNRYRFSDWYFYEMIYRHCGNPFKSKREKDSHLNHIRNKVLPMLGLEAQNDDVSLSAIKRFMGPVYNASCRTVRNNIENRLCFFLSPFADHSVSMAAQSAVPFLGGHHNFEKQMIQLLDPEAGGIALDYGYSINQKVPFRYRILPQIKRISGLRGYYGLRKMRKGNSRLSERMMNAHPFLGKYVEAVRELSLPVSVDVLLASDHLSPLIFELGMFVEEFGNSFKND